MKRNKDIEEQKVIKNTEIKMKTRKKKERNNETTNQIKTIKKK